MSNKEQAQTADGVNIVAGIWLLLSPFILGFGGVALTNNVIVGIVVGVFALIRATSWLRAVWLDWANGILGLWLILSPFVLGFGGDMTATWNNIILGIVVGALAIWGGSATYSAPEHRQMAR